MDYMAQKLYYEAPKQVAFYSFDDEKYIGGIAYQNEIICGCCGGIFEIKELYDEAPEGIEPIIEYAAWVDIEETILGDDRPVIPKKS
jgi:hypothetical protein